MFLKFEFFKIFFNFDKDFIVIQVNKVNLNPKTIRNPNIPKLKTTLNPKSSNPNVWVGFAIVTCLI